MPGDWTPPARSGWFAPLLLALVVGCAANNRPQPLSLEGFSTGSYGDEQLREAKLQPDARVLIDAPAPAQLDMRRPTRLIIYALPNGNTIEQTFGARKAAGLDWH